MVAGPGKWTTTALQGKTAPKRRRTAVTCRNAAALGANSPSCMLVMMLPNATTTLHSRATLGAMDTCKVLITRDRIDVLQALAFVNSPFCGGTSIFVGTTRITENGEDTQQVAHLIYEAYEDMALATMREIVESFVRNSDGLHKVYVCHRIGQVDLGQESILIAVSSPHRASSHQMVMQILNDIKRRVPIWKKICFAQHTKPQSESSEWSSNSEAFWLDNK